ncbi:hypothetical protein CRE_23118 [Caenorhabditis remanei]|uniref:Uncharacterized protein n=1 Tax=Caenorhabditis remanei TaxID=31234 RepID=E3ND12_CAERE|nr:hypothetical protein CRE_23118 [Caenorhabditis remanei]
MTVPNKISDKQLLDQDVIESVMHKVIKSKEAIENISLDLDRHLSQRNAKILELEKKLADTGERL